MSNVCERSCGHRLFYEVVAALLITLSTYQPVVNFGISFQTLVRLFLCTFFISVSVPSIY